MRIYLFGIRYFGIRNAKTREVRYGTRKDPVRTETEHGKLHRVFAKTAYSVYHVVALRKAAKVRGGRYIQVDWSKRPDPTSYEPERMAAYIKK